MKIAMLAMTLLILAGVAACASGPGSADKAEIVERWEGGQTKRIGHLPAATAMLITSNERWELVWEEYLGRRPPVELGKDQVGIAVFGGTRTTGGYRIDAQLQPEAGNGLLVKGTLYHPLPGAHVTHGFTSPWYMATIDLPEGVQIKVSVEEMIEPAGRPRLIEH